DRQRRAGKASRVTDGTGSSRSLFTNMAYAGVSAASAGLLLILFVVAGRFLGDIEFGKFSFALMLGTIFETLMDFGFHQVIIREVARDGALARDLLGHTLGIKLLWAGGGLVALLVTATVLRGEWDVRRVQLRPVDHRSGSDAAALASLPHRSARTPAPRAHRRGSLRRAGRGRGDAGIRVCSAAAHPPVWSAVRAGGRAVPGSL